MGSQTISIKGWIVNIFFCAMQTLSTLLNSVVIENM